MANVYYITICWNQCLFYDGYVVRKENADVYGFTDDTVITGNSGEIYEITQMGGTVTYAVSEKNFLAAERLGGATICTEREGRFIKVTIKRNAYKNEKYVKERSREILATYPEYIQQIYRRDYLEEE